MESVPPSRNLRLRLKLKIRGIVHLYTFNEQIIL